MAIQNCNDIGISVAAIVTKGHEIASNMHQSSLRIGTNELLRLIVSRDLMVISVTFSQCELCVQRSLNAWTISVALGLW